MKTNYLTAFLVEGWLLFSVVMVAFNSICYNNDAHIWPSWIFSILPKRHMRFGINGIHLNTNMQKLPNYLFIPIKKGWKRSLLAQSCFSILNSDFYHWILLRSIYCPAAGTRARIWNANVNCKTLSVRLLISIYLLMITLHKYFLQNFYMCLAIALGTTLINAAISCNNKNKCSLFQQFT